MQHRGGLPERHVLYARRRPEEVLLRDQVEVGARPHRRRGWVPLLAMATVASVTGCADAGASSRGPVTPVTMRGHVLLDRAAPDFGGPSANDQGPFSLAEW